MLTEVNTQLMGFDPRAVSQFWLYGILSRLEPQMFVSLTFGCFLEPKSLWLEINCSRAFTALTARYPSFSSLLLGMK